MVFIPHQILRGQSNQEANDWLGMLHRFREKTACRFLVGKNEVTRPPGTPWRKCKGNIKIYVKEMGLD
jgi:hypothetical protein